MRWSGERDQEAERVSVQEPSADRKGEYSRRRQRSGQGVVGGDALRHVEAQQALGADKARNFRAVPEDLGGGGDLHECRRWRNR